MSRVEGNTGYGCGGRSPCRAQRIIVSIDAAPGPSPWKPNVLTRSPICCPTFSSVRPICGGIFDFDTRSTRLAAVVRELEDPRIWEDQKRAQELGKEKKQLDGVVGTLTELDRRLKDSTELFELARGEADDATLRAGAGGAAG